MIRDPCPVAETSGSLGEVEKNNAHSLWCIFHFSLLSAGRGVATGSPEHARRKTTDMAFVLHWDCLGPGYCGDDREHDRHIFVVPQRRKSPWNGTRDRTLDQVRPTFPQAGDSSLASGDIRSWKGKMVSSRCWAESLSRTDSLAQIGNGLRVV